MKKSKKSEKPVAWYARTSEKRVFWAVKIRSNNMWFTTYGGPPSSPRAARVDVRYRQEYASREEAIADRSARGYSRASAKIVKVTVKRKPIVPLLFEPGDVWEWTDKLEAAQIDAEVGDRLQVDGVDAKTSTAVLSVLSPQFRFNIDDTAGLKLVERGGKRYYR